MRKQLGTLKYLSRDISKSWRKTLAEGFIISRLQYVIPLWGGTTRNHMNKLQVILNNTARCLLGENRMSHTKGLMEKCRWLTVREMADKHSLSIMWKILRKGIRGYFGQKISLDGDNRINMVPARLIITSRLWDTLPDHLRESTSLTSLKSGLRTWLLDQRTGHG